jgi:hypothetical protein
METPTQPHRPSRKRLMVTLSFCNRLIRSKRRLSAPSRRNSHQSIHTIRNWGQEFAVDRELRNADPDDYDALLLPGGQMNPDSLRMDQQAVAFVTFVVASSGNTFSKVELEDLQQNGAVGDICFCFYDANGREGKGALEGRVIGDRYAGRCRCEASRLHRR